MFCSGFRKIIKSSFYPKKFSFEFFGNARKYKYTYILGLGGNIGGDEMVLRRFHALLAKMKKDRRIKLISSSVVLKNKAFGYENQGDFLNAILKIKSSVYAQKMLGITQHYEKIFGRKRSFKDAPRTLDIDIIDFSAKIRQSERLRLPHIAAHERLSVILPLALMGEKI